jgi:hypothetical protein
MRVPCQTRHSPSKKQEMLENKHFFRCSAMPANALLTQRSHGAADSQEEFHAAGEILTLSVRTQGVPRRADSPDQDAVPPVVNVVTSP